MEYEKEVEAWEHKDPVYKHLGIGLRTQCIFIKRKTTETAI